MDARQVFADDAVKQEFLDRFPELAEAAAAADGRALESLEGGIPVDVAAATADSMAEGTYDPGAQPGLEAIVERFTRPVHLVQDGSFVVPPDEFPNSEEIRSRLEKARHGLEAAIPSAGRIDLRNHRLDWVGTGWMVAPRVLVTNRHVAREFATQSADGFAFQQSFGGPPVRASIDWRREHQRPAESRLRVEEVLWIEPDGSVDVALLRTAEHGEDGEELPPPIELMTDGELAAAGVGTWVAVIGYPAQDSRNDAQDQQRIFDGVYNVKRLAPGQLTAVVAQDLVHHDATTLGGNSGSVVVDLETGKAVALHFGGIEGQRNEAVQAAHVRRLVDAKTG